MSKLAKVGIGMLGTRKAITVRYFLQKFLWCGTHTFAKWSKNITKLWKGQCFQKNKRVSRKTKEFPEKCNFLACSLDG